LDAAPEGQGGGDREAEMVTVQRLIARADVLGRSYEKRGRLAFIADSIAKATEASNRYDDEVMFTHLEYVEHEIRALRAACGQKLIDGPDGG